MGFPEALISSLGGLISTLTELVGVVAGDRRMIVKPIGANKTLLSDSKNEEIKAKVDQNQNETAISISDSVKESEAGQNSSEEDIYRNPEIYMAVPDLIEKNGYPCESHKVTTKDGYILTLFRIPHGRAGPSGSGGPPILLVHGLLNSAGAWVMHEPEKALGFILADEGYDCWMLNCRGSTYSREHVSFSTEDREFWEFSFHEMGTMDVSATIDYVLDMTGYNQLTYIGHSLGSSKLMIAFNEEASYADKIKLFVSFAPAVYLYKTTAKILSFNAHFYRQQKKVLDYTNRTGEFMSKTFLQQVKSLSRFVPNPEYFAAKCVTSSMYTMGGHNPEQIHWRKLPVIAGHTPSSSSVRTYIHCLQYFINTEFQQYDFGSEDENYKVYGQPTPPKYDLTKVQCPTLIFYGQNDLLCRPETVEQLSSELPNVIGCHRVDCEKFSHTDFLYAKDVDVLVYQKVLESIRDFA